jgi:hypothetical protein
LSKLSRTARFSGAVNLTDFIEAARRRPFVWGVHDCVHFAVAAATAQTGKTYPLPKYVGLRGAMRAAKEHNFLAEMDEHFTPCPCVPPPGSIVATKTSDFLGFRLGVVVSDKAAYVSPSGLLFARLRPATDRYWKVR